MRTLSALSIILALIYVEEAAKNQCFQCYNYDDKGNYFSFCPKNGTAKFGMAAFSACDGPCFYRSDATNKDLIVRGCTSILGTLPSPLPPDGCYNWNGAIFCLCRMPICNAAPLPDKSNGLSLDYMVNQITDTQDTDGILRCYQCLTYDTEGKFYPQCPKDAQVNVQTTFLDNCTGMCFTRSFSANSTKVARGCTFSQYGLPYPLPKDGCYDWEGDTYCVCNRSRCNGLPLGKSSGVEMDAHVDLMISDVEEDGTKHCYQCINYDEKGNYYKQCPKDSRVKNAYHAPCNGSCFIRSYDYDVKKVARGCSDSQWGLPNPLPPDGCYKYYSETWCVCTKSRCNGVALGTPQNIELDAHLKSSGGQLNGAKSVEAYSFVIIFCISCYVYFINVYLNSNTELI
ncbi:hypothetical protein Bpfe_005017 [Biomphalaria pfeifferi]|uniref:Uncharacterized protein n=1 Tax=Biomphalaria pfeifferi TaxID=112525 RepID=A0AAD8FJM8_BIOPF|nr:hypothetical protein Bpfe_005017 [Biomphalaria pfeifferi]